MAEHKMTEHRELVSIRAARPEDGPPILAMLNDLASFEGATHAPRLDAAGLERDVFGPTPTLNIVIAEQASGSQFRQMHGFVSYFRNYSSWEGNAGIHICDLWVSRDRRGQGVGSALLRHILSQNEGRRIDVFVVRKNEALTFYERLGFKEQTEWSLYRIEGNE
jgi:ribosomal protein S18 acetylase RimI-like enzyme